ncbi:MAG: TonB-dependent receptor [Bacteroidales bacterium]|nr:TonB-dependent receptor [Bacteroidales bacterium]
MTKRYTKKLILLLSLLFIGYSGAFAQGGDVTGKVTDASDGQLLSGVTVLIKGTQTGAITDVNGAFRIKVNPGDVLVFSFVGYKPQEITVQPNTVVNITLNAKAEFLEELVVIGYGVQKKEDATGSVSAISTKDFNKGSITSVPQLAVGKIPGVQITSVGGAPGEGSVIRIRRGSSLSASNDPLYVIDGVPVDNDGISGTRNALSTLNPNDIETFTVLRDASATAIYGNRASNGVILITTKKSSLGKDGKGKPISLEYNGTFSLYTVPKTIDVLNADEFRTIMNERYDSNETVLRMMGNTNTDWQDEIYQTAFGMDHYIGISGAVNILPYRFSVGYTDEDGILKTDNMKRTTLGLSLNPSLFDDHLKININAKGNFVKNHFADQGAIGAALQYDPTQPVTADSLHFYDSETEKPIYFPNPYGGYYAWIQTYNQDPVAQGSSNPVALLNMRDDNSDVKRLIGNIQLDYKLHFFPDLHLNLNLGLDDSWSDGTVDVPEYAAWEYDAVNTGGIKTVYDQSKKNEILEFYGNYVKDVESIHSNFNVMAGYSWQHFWREGSNYSTNVAGTLVNDSSDYASESYLISLYGRFIYAFKNRYLATFTFRNDRTSRFSPETRAGWFPSAALAWKINEEPWMAGLENLSQLKLRLGWGVTGQQNIGTLNDYSYMARYTYSEPTAAYQFGDYYYITLRPEGYDYSRKWEETTTWNIGLDYGFLKDRIYGSLDFYYRETKDMLNTIPVPAGSNLTNYILTNVGNMENKGVEFAIFTKPVVTKDWMWELNFNATYSINEITKLTATADTNYLGVLTGNISGGVGSTVQIQSVGFPMNSFFVYEQVYDADGNPIEGIYVDRNGDGAVTDEDRYQYKDANPKFWFGISSTLTYKNWDLFFAGRANFGNYVYNNVSSENGVYQRLYRAEGPYIGNVTSDVTTINFVGPQYLSDYFIQDGSFFKMDVISLSYLFDDIINKKVDLRISATVNNAFTITNYTGIDPEINNGIDNRIYPRPRVYALGINLSF